MMTVSPPWQAVAFIVEHNTRDLIAKRFTLGSEVASWFKALSLFQEAETERLVENDPAPDDLNWHRAILATLLADGERLLIQWKAAADQGRNADQISRADLEATVRGLYATQAMWHGELSVDQRNAIIQQVFGVDPKALEFGAMPATTA